MAGKNELFKVSVNGFDFEISREQAEAIDLLTESPGNFHLLHHHRSVKATVMETDRTARKQTIEIEGENYVVAIKDELDQVMDKMGFDTAGGKHIKEIKAPMPGLVLEISVSEGQQVKEGDKLLILVAMKMDHTCPRNHKAGSGERGPGSGKRAGVG
jgi:acetyl/propionyl-CoA carboxylase alpha subunit